MRCRGNTSACAEKSAQQFPPGSSSRKYLRVRGEEGIVAPLTVVPPGNTSACAEKRGGRCLLRRWRRKYLRVRGEEHRGPNPDVT